MRRWIATGILLLLLAPLPGAAAQGPIEAAQQAFQAGRFAEAATTLQQSARSDPNDASPHYWLGRCYYELRRYDQASQEVEQAIKLDGRESDYHFWLGRIYGHMAETHHSLWLGIRTGKEFERAIQLDPKNMAARRALVEFYAGAPWIIGGSKNKARAQIAAIAAQNPVQGDLAEADYDHMMGNLAGARANYQKVLDVNTATPVEYYEAADFYAGQRNAAQLERAIDNVLHVAPNDPRLSYYQGVVLTIEDQKLDEAESYLKSYLAATVNRSDYPSHADARTWLGHVYEQMGRRLAAAEQYRAALQLDPNSGFAKQSLQVLEKQMK
ncbi:MAG TPA: tetratricopeptide repeat protein [Candidatus Dormibacteraeota bacterium]|nr:tetratricopeptide repeat protein [Candidatus Dormibacteraeota bacterium]